MPTYQLSGLTIHSELELPGVPAGAEPWGAHPYTFRTSELAAHRAVREIPDDAPWLSIVASSAGYLLRFHEHADFWIDVDGGAIRCERTPECTPDVVAHLLLDRVIPHLVLLGGRPSFHASAVAPVGDQVVAFMGKSGAGKSTLAASFGAECAVAGDDTLALSFEGEMVVVHPNSPSVRLHPDSAAEVLPSGAHPVQRAGKLQAQMRGPLGPLRLARIYFLETGEGAPEILPVGRRDAIASLAHHLYRLDAHDRTRLHDELATLELLATRVRCARLRYRRRFEDLEELRLLVREDAGSH